jgi:hypothetical protein
MNALHTGMIDQQPIDAHLENTQLAIVPIIESGDHLLPLNRADSEKPALGLVQAATPHHPKMNGIANKFAKKLGKENPTRPSKTLSEQDREILHDLEAKVEGSFLTSCEALLKIEEYEDGRLWNGIHKSFILYVKARFGFSSRFCKLMVRAASFNRAVRKENNGTPTLEKESHIRPIIQKIKPDSQVKFWNDFCSSNEINQTNVSKLKASQIRKAVEEYISENEDKGIQSDKPKKNVDKQVKAQRDVSKLITKIKKILPELPNQNEVEIKLEELLKLIKNNN